MTNDVFLSARGSLYGFGFIPSGSHLDFNQSSGSDSGKSSSPVGLSVQLVGGCYGLSVKGLQLVTVFSCLVKKMIPTQSQVRIFSQASWYVLSPVGKM